MDTANAKIDNLQAALDGMLARRRSLDARPALALTAGVRLLVISSSFMPVHQSMDDHA
jgi:hypothetical protein